MALRDDDADLVVEQVLGLEEGQVLLELAEVGALVGERHRDVAVAVAQRRDDSERFCLREGDGDVGVALLEDGERLGDEGRGRAGEGLEPNPAGPQPGNRGDLLLGGIEGGEHADRVAREDLAGLGEADLAAVALDPSTVPVRCSRRRTIWEIAGWEKPRALAAPVKLPSSAIAFITRRPAASIMLQAHN